MTLYGMKRMGCIILGISIEKVFKLQGYYTQWMKEAEPLSSEISSLMRFIEPKIKSICITVGDL